MENKNNTTNNVSKNNVSKDNVNKDNVNKNNTNNEVNKEKKHRTLVSWGKFALIFGCFALVGGAATGVYFLLSGEKTDPEPVYNKVTSEECKAAFDSLRTPTITDTSDNRNFECKMTGKIIFTNGQTVTYNNITRKYSNNFNYWDMDMVLNSTVQKGNLRYKHLGNNTYYVNELEDGKISNNSLMNEVYYDHIGAIAKSEYNFNDFTFDKGVYSGNFTITYGLEAGYIYKCTLPIDIKFNSDKKIENMHANATKISVTIKESSSSSVATATFSDVNIDFYNYGKTTVDLSDKDFPMTTVTYDGTSTEVSQDLGTDYTNSIIIVLEKKTQTFNDMKLFLNSTASEEGGSTPYFYHAYSNGSKISITTTTNTLSITDDETKVSGQQVDPDAIGNKTYIQTSSNTKTTEYNLSSSKFEISQIS